MQKKTAIGVAGVFLVIAGIWRLYPRAEVGSVDGGGVAVLAAAAAIRDMPVYVTVPAAVQAGKVIQIRPRVDGEIVRVDFGEGSRVRRGQVLFELDRRPFEATLRAARAQRQRDEAQFENAKLDEARYETLARADSVPTQTLDAARAQKAQLGAALSADDAQIESASIQLGFATIRAPVSGIAGALQVDQGNLVHASDPGFLSTLAQIHPVQLEFSLPQSLVQALRQKHAIDVDAFEEEGGRFLERGKLTMIDNQIDAATGTVLCKATFVNGDEKFWPGEFVSARVHLADLHRVVVVPSKAVQPSDSGPFVYVVTSKGRAAVRRVETGAAEGNDTEIRTGLEEGEIVVTEGQFRIEQGTKVSARIPGGNARR